MTATDLAPAPARASDLNSLGFAKPAAQTRVVVAMSGGVDSSVVAAKLKSEGYDVIGVTLQLYDHGAALAKKGACCAGQDIHDARRVAERMGFPHYVLDYENRFRESVIDEFADACDDVILSNKTIKQINELYASDFSLGEEAHPCDWKSSITESGTIRSTYEEPTVRHSQI